MVPLDDTGRRRRHRSKSFSLLITNSETPITKIPHTDDETIVAIVVVVNAAHCVTPFKLASVLLESGMLPLLLYCLGYDELGAHID